jgi:DNA-binding transcriptional MocR family regulator
MDAADVLRDALAEKVAFVPGAAFFSDGSGTNTMRLNFTNASVERIEEGIGRLGRVLWRRVESHRLAT